MTAHHATPHSATHRSLHLDTTPLARCGLLRCCVGWQHLLLRRGGGQLVLPGLGGLAERVAHGAACLLAALSPLSWPLGHLQGGVGSCVQTTAAWRRAGRPRTLNGRDRNAGGRQKLGRSPSTRVGGQAAQLGDSRVRGDVQPTLRSMRSVRQWSSRDLVLPVRRAHSGMGRLVVPEPFQRVAFIHTD